MKHLVRFFVAFSWLFVAACSSPEAPDCLKSTGKNIRIKRALPDFDRLQIDNNIEIVIVPDTSNFVIVEGGENVVPLLRTTVENNQLRITNNNSCNWVRSYKRLFKATVHLKNLREIEQLGYGNIYTTDTIFANALDIKIYGVSEVNIAVKTDYLGVDISGLGTLNLSGKTHYLSLTTNRTPHINAASFTTNEANITHKAETDFLLHCSDTLRAEMLRAGNLIYTGSPWIKANIKNTGRLIRQQ
jgi:hypothetical protein